MQLADYVSAHLPEFAKATWGDVPHEESRAEFLRLIRENRGTEPPTISPGAWRNLVPHWKAAVRTMKPDLLPSEPAPARFEGWTVTKPRGYIRLVRKRHGRMEHVYVGRRWDPETAREKIVAKGY